MSSLMLHYLPQLLSWNLRWTTIPYEESLPEDKRRFGNLDTSFTWNSMLLLPLLFYFSWVSIYFSINFVVAKERIRKRKYETLYGMYLAQTWSKKILDNFDAKWGIYGGPIIFMVFHFCFFLTGHFFAVICFYSYYFHTFWILLYLIWSIWNASGFYMNYFAKKYQQSLNLLEEA